MYVKKENVIVYTIELDIKDVDLAGNSYEIYKLLAKKFEKVGLLKEAARIEDYFYMEDGRTINTKIYKVWKVTKTRNYIRIGDHITYE